MAGPISKSQVSQKAKFDFRDLTVEDLHRAHPRLVEAALTISRVSGIPFEYLIATLYVESGFRADASNGDARGAAQIKPLAWKEAVADERFAEWFQKVAPGLEIPAGPGQLMIADMVALAVLTRLREQDCLIDEWCNGDKKSQAWRLCYHLKTETAIPKIKDIQEGRAVVFKDKGNQMNWNRFRTVLDKAKLTATLEAALAPILAKAK